MAEQLSRTAFLNAALSELGAYWLGIECGGCRASVFYPCKLLAKERGESLRVGDVVSRLRCRQCKGVAGHVFVTDDPAGGGQSGSSHAWRVELVP
jgi:hypothetical protein